MLLRLEWFRKPRSKRAVRRSSSLPAIERLEDRALLTATWNNFGGNAQHTDVSQVAAQPLNHLLWSTPLDLAPWGAVHYGDPVFTPGNTVVVPIKVTWSAQDQNEQNFYLAGLNDVTGAVEWTSAVTGSVTGASNASPIVITTASTSGLATGESVTLGGVNGNTAANGSFSITVLNSTQFQLNGSTGNGAYTSGGTWAYNPNGASYIAPTYNWLAPLQPVYDPVTDRVYFAGPGGTIDYINHPDNAGSSTPTVFQEAFYGLSNYTANESAYNSSIYINTGLTVDSSGNVYFGFTETGTNPSSINDGGFARITPTGAATYTLAYSAVGQTNDGNWNPALGQSPALSNDGSTIYFGVTDSGYALNFNNESNSYLVGLNSTTLAPQDSVRMIDPATGAGAVLIDESTASPMVAPDNTVYMGVFSSNYNGSRGFLLHYSGDLGTEYTPGAFGWDDTPSIVPTSMVPSYTGTSSYLILSKYNNYANTEVGEPYGGNGVNQIAVLDPYASQLDPNYDANPNLQVMKQVMTMASVSPDVPNANAGDPNAVREWCTNGTVVDPGTDSVYVNNEDGYTYQWNLGTGLVTNAVQITSGVGVPYTPTAIAPNGEIYSDNGGTLFALGGYSNYTMSTVSSADPSIVGNSITLTTTLASTNSGPTPTGTVTYTYYQGANNPLNYNTTPVTIGTANVVNGVASIPVSGLVAAHYHIYASYSGDSTYSSGQTILVQPVLETATTTVSGGSGFAASGGPSFSASGGRITESGPQETAGFYYQTITLNTSGLRSISVQANVYPGATPTSLSGVFIAATPSSTFANGASLAVDWTNGSGNVYAGFVNGSNQGFFDSADPGVPIKLQFVETATNVWTVTYSENGNVLKTLTNQSFTLPTQFAVGVYGFTNTTNGTFPQWANLAIESNPIGQESNSIAQGTGVTLTATVTPNGTTFVPIGTVTFMDGSTVLGTVPLNNLESETNPPSTNTASLTVPSLPGGTNAITAVYSGDQNFAGDTSAIFNEYVPAVTNPGTQDSAVGDNVSLQVQAIGLPPGDTWTYSASSLPSGLSIDAGTGVITGTITGSANTYSATVTASDGQGDHPSQTFSWNVSVLSETNPGTQNNAVGDSVSLQVQDSGLPSGDSWSYSATLPSGLSIDPATGLISGTISGSANTYSASVTASDGQGASATQDFTWNVSVLSVTNPGTQNNAVGDSVSLQVQDSGLPSGDSWSYSASGLPSGLSIDPNTGLISGTVTGSANTYSGSVTASDGQGASATQDFTWNVSLLAVTNPGTQNNAVGDTVSLQVQDTGLPSGDSWSYSASGLPSGLSIDPNTGLISGTVTGSANTYSGSVTASDGQGGSASQSFAWNVSLLTVTNPGTQNNAVGDSVSLQVQDSGLPSGDSWSYSATLPSGLSINPSTGLITGTITGSANTYSASVTASDGQGASATQAFIWNVSVLSVTNPGTQNNAVGDTVSLQVQDTGLPNGDSWSYAATLPSGLSINPATGLVSGTLTGSANTYSASVTASDGQGAGVTQAFTWNVSVLSVTNPGTQNSALGASVSLQIHDSGLPSGDSWSYSATGLPSGLSINPGTGLISGTITGSPATYSASVTASDGNGASVSQSFTWNVGPTTTTLTSSVDPSDYGQRVTFTATVAAVVTGSGKPTGSVEFLDGSTVLSTVTLNTADKATYTTTAFALPVGGDSITAVYLGSTKFETSTSNVVTQTVNADPTTTTVKSSAATAVFGQSVTLTATVTANSPGSGTPTGTVTFFDGNTPLGPGTLNSSGKATFVTSSLPLGSNSITAVYNGSGNYLSSPSGTLTETINPAATRTVVATSGSPSVFGQSVTFTATVTVRSPGSGTPTGTVEFKDGSTVLGTGTINGSGQATYTTSALSVGSHSITAVFEGDTDFTTSTSGAITQRVTKAPTGAAVTPSQSSVASGTPVTFTASIAPTAPGAGMPTGTVTFYSGSTVLGTATLNSSGEATLTKTWKTAGTYQIKVKYNGDANFNSITSSLMTETVT